MQGRESRSATAESTAPLPFWCLSLLRFRRSSVLFFAGRDGRGERKTREGETQERGENVAGLGIFGVCFLGELSWLLNA